MNSGKLSADVQTDGNFNAQVNNAAEPGSRPVGGVHGDGRNLDQEGQQFANLLHGSSEAATSSVDAAPGKLPAGQPFESPFSIHLKYPAPGNPEHPAPIGHEHPAPGNPEHPAPIGHEHPSPANPERPAPIGHEHPSPANPERPAPIDHEHPASVNPERPAPIGHEHPSSVNPERPAPIGHEHPTIGHEHHESINLAFLTGQERVLPTSPGSGSGLGVKVENPAVAVADATLPHPQSSTEPMINQPTPATMAGFQSELKSSADPTAKTPHPFVVNERGPAGLSMTQGAEKPVQPPVIPPKEATQPEPAASADSKPETPTGDRILQGLLGQPAQPTTPFLDQPASPVSSASWCPTARTPQIPRCEFNCATRCCKALKSPFDAIRGNWWSASMWLTLTLLSSYRRKLVTCNKRCRPNWIPRYALKSTSPLRIPGGRTAQAMVGHAIAVTRMKSGVWNLEINCDTVPCLKFALPNFPEHCVRMFSYTT